MKVIIALVLALSAVAPVAANPPSQKQQPTLLGLQNPHMPETARAIGAKAVRLIHPRKQLGQAVIDRAKGYNEQNITVILTIHRWFGQDELMRSVGSREWNEALAEFATFLPKVAPFIEGISLDNEPVFEFPERVFKKDSSGRVPAIEWYKALAGRTKELTKTRPDLAHLKVLAPSVNTYPGIDDPRDQSPFAILFRWANADANVDVIDLHAHVAAVPEIEKAVDLIMRNTKKPLVLTEWSQAKAANKWRQLRVNPHWAAKWKVDRRRTNEHCLAEFLEHPVSKEKWDEFVATIGYDPEFIPNAFTMMDRKSVAIAFYGAHQQYGNVAFDTKQILANRSVVPGPDGLPQGNYKFAEWFRAAAKSQDGRR